MQNKLTQSLEENIAMMRQRFDKDKTVKERHFGTAEGAEGLTLRMCIFFCDGMVSADRINDNIIKPVTLYRAGKIEGDMLTFVEQHVVQSNESAQSDDMDEIAYAMLYGDTILLCEGCSKALILNTKGFAMRGISEPNGETVVKGPREGFNEGILLNLSLLRRKIRNSNLKYEFLTLGTESKTICCLCYIEGIVAPKVLAEVRSRLSKVKIDGILGSNYVSEMIRDCWWSPFKTVGSTERPDVVAAKLLEGRVALVVDGTPVVITMPHLFIEHFQASEDYYISFQYAAISRFLRIVGFFMAISVAPMYIALITYHQEMLPTALLYSISGARDGVPFPTIIEAIGLLFSFDILREAGARTPSNVGQTLSIVGALVLGQAAVEARFVSAPMVIVIAFSGITGLIIPKLSSTVIILRLGFILLVSVSGLYGYLFGLVWMLCHLASLRSFGVPVLESSLLSFSGSHEDALYRAPFSKMKKRGRFLSQANRKAGKQG